MSNGYFSLTTTLARAELSGEGKEATRGQATRNKDKLLVRATKVLLAAVKVHSSNNKDRAAVATKCFLLRKLLAIVYIRCVFRDSSETK